MFTFSKVPTERAFVPPPRNCECTFVGSIRQAFPNIAAILAFPGIPAPIPAFLAFWEPWSVPWRGGSSQDTTRRPRITSQPFFPHIWHQVPRWHIFSLGVIVGVLDIIVLMGVWDDMKDYGAFPGIVVSGR